MASTTYYWDELDDNVCCEEDENGDITASYTHEPGLHGEVIAQKRGNEVRYFNFDGEGNTSELTDDEQNVTDTYEYSAFGEEIARTGTTENPFGYKGALGYYTNGETNGIYVRARMYKPTVGRWLSRDPDRFSGDQWYSYVNNQPVSWYDPSGLCTCCCCPESLDFSKVRPANFDELRLQLIFQVDASLRMDEERTEPGGMCKIEWYECSAGGGDLGQKPGKWFRAPSPSDDPPPTKKVFSDWNDPPPMPCSGKFKRFWRDTPTVGKGVNNRVDIKFAVRVSGGLNCECGGNNEMRLLFGLHTRIKTFNPSFPDLTEFEPENPPILTPGLSGVPAACTENNIPW